MAECSSDPSFQWSLQPSGLLLSHSTSLCLDAQYVPAAPVGCFLSPYNTYAWCNTTLSNSERASLLLAAMSNDDKDLLLGGSAGPYVGNTPANYDLGECACVHTCVCACVRVCVRACVRACVRVKIFF